MLRVLPVEVQPRLRVPRDAEFPHGVKNPTHANPVRGEIVVVEEESPVPAVVQGADVLDHPFRTPVAIPMAEQRGDGTVLAVMGTTPRGDERNAVEFLRARVAPQGLELMDDLVGRNRKNVHVFDRRAANQPGVGASLDDIGDHILALAGHHEVGVRQRLVGLEARVDAPDHDLRTP